MKWLAASLLIPLLLQIAACNVGKPLTNSVVIPEALFHCDRSTHTPKPLPSLMTATQFTKGYNDVELSREAVIRELLECDDKRQQTLILLQKELENAAKSR